MVGAWASAGGWAAHAVVEVEVADVNDHAPFFVRASPQVTLIEEDDRDLPASVLKVGVLIFIARWVTFFRPCSRWASFRPVPDG